MSTSSLQLDAYFRKEPLYGGCWSQDELEDKETRGFYILNLQPSGEGNGSHWVLAVFQPITPVPVYIDPYGVSPPPAIERFLRRGKKGHLAIYSKLQYQALESNNCGYYCVEAADELLDAMKRKDKNSLDNFDDDLTPYPSKANEKLVRRVKL